MIVTKIINSVVGGLKNNDYDFAMPITSILNQGVITGLIVSSTQVTAGKCLVLVTRTNTTPNEQFLMNVELTTTETIITGNNKFIYIEVPQANINDNSLNVNLNGSGIATVTVGTSYPASNYIALATTNGSGVVTDARTFINLKGISMGGVLKTAKSTNLASATTTSLSTATGNTAHITGTTTITSFGTGTAGETYELIFDGALILTHNATSLILPGSANITTSAGDTATVVSEGGSNWRVVKYQKVNGQAIDNSVNITGLTEDTTGNIVNDFFVKNNGAGANTKIKVSKYMATDGEASTGTSEVKFVNPKQMASLYKFMSIVAGITYTSASSIGSLVVNGGYTKIKEITVNANGGGIYRVNWTTSGSYSNSRSRSKIYVNGVAVSTERDHTGFGPFNETYDVTVNGGDLVQLYVWQTIDIGSISNYSLTYDIDYIKYKGTVTL